MKKPTTCYICGKPVERLANTVFPLFFVGLCIEHAHLKVSTGSKFSIQNNAKHKCGADSPPSIEIKIYFWDNEGKEFFPE